MFLISNSSSESELLQSASDSLFRCIALKGAFTNALDVALANSRSDETIAVLRAAVLSLGLCPARPPSSSSPGRSRSDDISVFPPTGTSITEVKRYVTRLADLYTDRKVYTSLVADLIGSYACETRYTMVERYHLENSSGHQLPVVTIEQSPCEPDRFSTTSGSTHSFKTVMSTF